MIKILVFSAWGVKPTPWSVPNVSRFGGSYYDKKSRPYAGIMNLPDWQAYVKGEAEKAMLAAGAPLQLGPVKLHIDFYQITPPGRRHGELWTVGVQWNPKSNNGEGGWVKEGRSMPDLLNLFKGTEDALESVTYANDVQCCIISSSRWYGPLPGVKVTVYGIEPTDFLGLGEPVPTVAEIGKAKALKVRDAKRNVSYKPKRTKGIQ